MPSSPTCKATNGKQKGRSSDRPFSFLLFSGFYRSALRRAGGRRGVTGCQHRADIHGMQTLRSLQNIELDRLAGLESLVAVHLDSRVMGEQVLISAIGHDETVALGVVEPLDLTAEHADIPLQRTPSLEYHPLQLHVRLRPYGR